MSELADVTIVAEGLQFPEGPVVLADGSVLVVEVAGGRISRIDPDDGTVEVVAEPGGGPNGAALGPDGAIWVCNNGGMRWEEAGRIERVDLATGSVEVVTTSGGGHPLRGPNDLVFDADGGLWFTDFGRASVPHQRAGTAGGIYYLPAGTDEAREVIFPLDAPNGIGLSPDGATLYWAETHTRRVRRRGISGPGELADGSVDPLLALARGGKADPDVLVALGGTRYLDSLAVDADGWVNVGTIDDAGVTTVSPEGEADLLRLPASLGERMVTNLCFGGADGRTAYLTLSLTGRLAACPWPRAGLPLAFA